MAHDTTTFCRICEAQCGLTVRVDGDRITAVQPDRAHVVSRGYVCVKGLTLENVRASPDRLLHPLKKVDGRYQRISWEQALGEIGGPDAIEPISGMAHFNGILVSVERLA